MVNIVRWRLKRCRRDAFQGNKQKNEQGVKEMFFKGIKENREKKIHKIKRAQIFNAKTEKLTPPP